MTEQAIVARASLIRRPAGDSGATGGASESARRGLRRSEKLELATLGVGLVHHADHVLRADHSGWPFIAEVTPFTFSLVVYPILLVVLLNRARPWLRAGLIAAVFLATQGAHLLIETPADQYGAWAHAGGPNLLGVASPALGLLSAGWSLLLSALLLATLAAFVGDAVRDGERPR
jgi:hypothetical protein